MLGNRVNGEVVFAGSSGITIYILIGADGLSDQCWDFFVRMDASRSSKLKVERDKMLETRRRWTEMLQTKRRSPAIGHCTIRATTDSPPDVRCPAVYFSRSCPFK